MPLIGAELCSTCSGFRPLAKLLRHFHEISIGVEDEEFALPAKTIAPVTPLLERRDIEGQTRRRDTRKALIRAAFRGTRRTADRC